MISLNYLLLLLQLLLLLMTLNEEQLLLLCEMTALPCLSRLLLLLLLLNLLGMKWKLGLEPLTMMDRAAVFIKGQMIDRGWGVKEQLGMNSMLLVMKVMEVMIMVLMMCQRGVVEVQEVVFWVRSVEMRGRVGDECLVLRSPSVGAREGLKKRRKRTR